MNFEKGFSRIINFHAVQCGGRNSYAENPFTRDLTRLFWSEQTIWNEKFISTESRLKISSEKHKKKLEINHHQANWNFSVGHLSEYFCVVQMAQQGEAFKTLSTTVVNAIANESPTP